MNWNDHSRDVPEGAHAFLSASQHSWVNYDKDTLIKRFNNRLAAERGTRLHNYARESIELGQRLPRSNKSLCAFVNDAIGFKMTPEQPLYFSKFCFGTTDAISFRKNVLRISDLKTGVLPASMQQLMIYMALFCLEYGVKPKTIDSELRIYQNDNIVTETPDPEYIEELMQKIIFFSSVLEQIENGEI